MNQPQPITPRERRKIVRQHKALIKDLELQIDYLIGYIPHGEHWKKSYWVRKKMLDETLANAPQEIVDKIATIQDVIYNLRNKIIHAQWYMPYTYDDYKEQRKIRVRWIDKVWYI